MNSYDYNSLKAAAEDAGVWIDVRDNKVLRGQGKGNTNKKERVSRALSWYEKSECAENADDKLIFSFIAYNALYAQPSKDGNDNGKHERDVFWEKLFHNGGDEIMRFVKKEVKNLEAILMSQYLSFLYWKDEGGMYEKHEQLRKEAERAKHKTDPQIACGNRTPVRLAMRRIGLLRNQLLHGMAAYQDSYNRHQVQLCADFLHPLVGRMIATVIGDKKQNWGKVPYPPQGYPNESCIEVKELED